MAELHSITADQDDKRRMLEILQRLHQQEVEGGGSDSEGGGSGGGDEEGDEGQAGLSDQTLHRLLAKVRRRWRGPACVWPRAVPCSPSIQLSMRPAGSWQTTSTDRADPP